MTEEKWFVTAKRADFQGIADRFGISPVTARLIRNRDIVGDAAIDAYLHGTTKDLSDPRLMKDMEKAAALIALLEQLEGGSLDPAGTIDVSTPDAVVLR